MEVENLWYLLALNRKQKSIYPLVDNFLSRSGRMKFIRPMYIAYAALDRNIALAVLSENVYDIILFILIII